MKEIEKDELENKENSSNNVESDNQTEFSTSTNSDETGIDQIDNTSENEILTEESDSTNEFVDPLNQEIIQVASVNIDSNTEENEFTKNEFENKTSTNDEKFNKEVNEIIFNKKLKSLNSKVIGPYIISGIALGLAVFAFFGASSDKNVVLYTVNESATTVPTSNSTNSLTGVVNKVSNSTVEIKSEVVSQSLFGTQSGISSGSGVIVSTDGYIVTNYHVIEGATNVTVTLASGEEYHAEVIGSDASNDIAVIKIDETNLIPVVFGDSSVVLPGEQVFAIGNPTGELGGSATFGYISATSRYVTIDNVQYVALQHDAAVSPGNSGGGLFTTDGNLIGIVSAKTVSTDVEGIGFAIPSNQVKDMVSDIIEYGYVKRPVIGITIVNINTEEAALFNRVDELGIYVQSVALNSDAARQGLKVGDLIVNIDGVDISSTNDIEEILQSKEIGDKIDVRIKREGTYINYNIELIDSVN